MLIDMHSHILPGADHGSDGINTSLEQLSRAKKAGVDVIVATPHFYHHRDDIKEFLERRKKSYEKLISAMPDAGYSDIRIILGAEVALEVDLVKENYLRDLCIEGTNRLLLEMPTDVKWSDWLFNAIFEIEAKFKVNPIIAHIDRYESKQTARLMKMGLDAQINASSLCGFMKRRNILKYVEDGSVKFIGSDIHGPKSPEYDEFAKCVRTLGDYADEIMYNSAVTLGLAKEDNDSINPTGLIF